MDPREGLVGDRLALALVVADLGGPDAVPDRGLPGPEDGRRAQQHPRQAVDLGERGVGVALGGGVDVGVVVDQGRALVDVAGGGRAVVDGGRRHVDQPGDAGVAGGPRDHRRALDRDLSLRLVVAAERVDGGDERGGAVGHAGGEVRVGEVADVLGEVGQVGRGPLTSYDGAHVGSPLDQRGAHPGADEAVGAGDDDDGARSAGVAGTGGGGVGHVLTLPTRGVRHTGRGPRSAAGQRPLRGSQRSGSSRR